MRTIRLPKEESLPLVDFKKHKNPDSKYWPLLMNELGLSDLTKEEVDTLRNMVADELMNISDRYVMQAMIDIREGKIERLEDIPLFREPDGKGGVIIRNIPDDCRKWLCFQIWLNELSDSM